MKSLGDYINLFKLSHCIDYQNPSPEQCLDSFAEPRYLIKIGNTHLATSNFLICQKTRNYDYLGKIRENKIFNSAKYPSSWIMLLDILFLGAHHIYNKGSDNYEWYDGWNSCILLDHRNRSTIENRNFSPKRRTGLGEGASKLTYSSVKLPKIALFER